MSDSVTHEPAKLAELGSKFQPHEQWRCRCAREHRFGPYASAHWRDELVHACKCGAKRTFRSGRVRELLEASGSPSSEEERSSDPVSSILASRRRVVELNDRCKPKAIDPGFLTDRLRSKFEKHFIPEPNSGCWLWTASLNRCGYGKITLHNFRLSQPKKTLVAHRVSYSLYRGEIPDGLVLDHTCRVRSCVNPWHLDLVTTDENLNRALLEDGTIGYGFSGEIQKARTHCAKGHEFTPENTRLVKRAKRKSVFTERKCVTCQRKATSESMKKLRRRNTLLRLTNASVINTSK